MGKSYIELSYLQVALAALLIVINGAVSILLKLGLERRLFLAAVCTVVQLLLDRFCAGVGLPGGPLVRGAGDDVDHDVRRGGGGHPAHGVRFPGIWVRSVAATWASSWLVAALALVVIVRVRPWYTPQYAIPLLGMILGNTLNGVSLGLDRLGERALWASAIRSRPCWHWVPRAGRPRGSPFNRRSRPASSRRSTR